MQYAKLIDGFIRVAPNPIYIDPYWVGNPTGEMLIGEGYKPVQYTDPGEAPSGYAWSETWSETETAIVQGWELVEASNEVDPYEAMEILFGQGG